MCEFDLLIVMEKCTKIYKIIITFTLSIILTEFVTAYIYPDTYTADRFILERENLVHNRHCVCFVCVS